MAFNQDPASIGTICFVTYNRGNLLLRTIKDLLPKLSDEWPVLVVDNASIKYQDEYKEIEALASISKSLSYHRHKENGLFEGNLLSLFDLVRTQFFLVVSDEDIPSIEALDELSPFLRENKDIGGIRTSIGTVPGVQPSQAYDFKDQVFAKAKGIAEFGLSGNYISGQIYNGILLKKLNIPQRLKLNIHANQWYPHLYLNVLTAANTRTIMSSSVACLEGTAVNFRPENLLDYFGPFSYGTRVDQFIALRNALYEGFIDIQKTSETKTFDIFGFYNAYLSLCSKYAMLIFESQGKLYHNQNIKLEFLSKSFSVFAIGAVEKLPYFERVKDTIAHHIAQTVEDWRKKIEPDEDLSA
jgi:hypothetical protein